MHKWCLFQHTLWQLWRRNVHKNEKKKRFCFFLVIFLMYSYLTVAAMIHCCCESKRPESMIQVINTLLILKVRSKRRMSIQRLQGDSWFMCWFRLCHDSCVHLCTSSSWSSHWKGLWPEKLVKCSTLADKAEVLLCLSSLSSFFCTAGSFALNFNSWCFCYFVWMIPELRHQIKQI